MPRNYLQPQRRGAMGTPAYDIDYGGEVPGYPGESLSNLPASEWPQADMDWGVQTDNLPAFTQPTQMPSPQRSERYETQYQPPTGSITTTTENGQQITTPIVPPGEAPTMGEFPEFEMPEDVDLPELGELPEFELPGYGEVPELELPKPPDYPEFVEPTRPSEKKYVQEAAAPGVRALRRTTREALSSANFAQNPIVQATIKEQVLRGHGDALSQIMGMARREGGEKAERIYRGKFETARINYQGKMTKARDIYQTKVMKAQTDWQGKMQALRDKWQGGLIKSRIEYEGELKDRRMKWMAEVDTIREKYRLSFSKSQTEYSAGIDKVLIQFEAEWRGYLAKFGKKVDITGGTTQEMQYLYGGEGAGGITAPSGEGYRNVPAPRDGGRSLTERMGETTQWWPGSATGLGKWGQGTQWYSPS